MPLPPVDVPDPGSPADETVLQALEVIKAVEPAAFAGPAHGSLQHRRESVRQTRQAMRLLRDAMEQGAAEPISWQGLETVHGAWVQACPLDREASGLEFMPAALADLANCELTEASGARQALRETVWAGLQELLRSQTAQPFRHGREADPWHDDATPDAAFAARRALRSYAAAGPAEAGVASQLLASWQRGVSRIHLTANGHVRRLPDAATVAALSGNVRMVQIDGLQIHEADDAFIAALVALDAEALLLSERSVFVPRVAGAASTVYLARSPKMRLDTPEVRQALEQHPALLLVADLSIKGTAQAGYRWPGRIEGRTMIDPETLQEELDRDDRWTDGLTVEQRAALRTATSSEREIRRSMLDQCERFAESRPDIKANVELLLRHMADDPAFRADACGQIRAWAPVCADDWISCVSSVLSARHHAGPITDVEEGARRIWWQSMLQEVNRIAWMRDPAPLPKGAWDFPDRSLAVETALMLRQAVDQWMRSRHGVTSARHVPQIFAHQSAVDERDAADVVERMVQSERESGFPMALAFARDSDAWKAYVATLPNVAEALEAAHGQAMAALEARPQDDKTIQADYLRQCDDIRARPLRETLAALAAER